MIEELYIIRNNKKYRLDLKSPSGITLKFQSNIFGDVSKITASYSYTFKLPLTANNRRLLDMSEDVRHKSTTTRTKIQAEFHQDGVPIIGNGNLYVSNVQSEYQCVMTWDVAPGFAELKENDCNLNELPDNGDKVTYAGATKDDVTLISQFDNSAKALTPWYGCGVKNWWEVSNRPTNFMLPPLPVVPVYRIISLINQTFGTNFKLGNVFDNTQFSTSAGAFPILRNDIVNRGVVPLTSIDIDDSDLDKEIATIKIGQAITNCYRSGDDYECWAFKGIDPEDLSVYDKIIVDITNSQTELLRGNNDFLSVQSYSFYNSWVESGVIHTGKYFELDGFIVASFKNVKNVDYQPPVYSLYSAPKLTLYYVKWQPDSDNPTTGKYVGESVASISGTPYLGSNSDGEWFIFDFREAEGMSRLKVEAIVGSSNPFFFAFDYKVVSINGSMQAIPIYNEKTNVGNGGYDIPIIPNLPDISCLTFMKSLFFMLGAFPTTNKVGEIVPIYFDDLKLAIENNEALDWSDKIIGSSKDLASKVDYSVSGFGQKNYYLMKSDTVEEKKDENEEDVFENGVGCIVVESDVIDAQKTIIQLPYNAPFIKNNKVPHLATGNTFKCWDAEYDNDGYLEFKFKEPKPCFGMIVGRAERQYNGSGDANDIANYNPTGRWLEYMEAWNGFKNFEDNPSYAYLQKILSSPIIITEDLRLTNLDLMSLDYTKPVYLDKYNAFFAIVSVQRDSKGKCKVELIKLP